MLLTLIFFLFIVLSKVDCVLGVVWLILFVSISSLKSGLGENLNSLVFWF